jgi:hypothetical protein
MEGMLRVNIGSGRTDTIGPLVLLDLFSLFRYVCVCGWITGKRIMDNGRPSSAAIDATEDDYGNDGYQRRIMRKENRGSKPERKEGSL